MPAWLASNFPILCLYFIIFLHLSCCSCTGLDPVWAIRAAMDRSQCSVTWMCVRMIHHYTSHLVQISNILPIHNPPTFYKYQGSVIAGSNEEYHISIRQEEMSITYRGLKYPWTRADMDTMTLNLNHDRNLSNPQYSSNLSNLCHSSPIILLVVLLKLDKRWGVAQSSGRIPVVRANISTQLFTFFRQTAYLNCFTSYLNCVVESFLIINLVWQCLHTWCIAVRQLDPPIPTIHTGLSTKLENRWKLVTS